MPGRPVLLVALMLALAATLAPAAGGAIKIAKIRYNSPGSDTGTNASLNAEWIKLRNTGPAARSLGGWRIRDSAGHGYRFAAGYRLAAGKTVMIHTGSGPSGARHRYWGQGNYIWNNDQDRATLKNAAGRVVDRCAYNNSSASKTTC